MKNTFAINSITELEKEQECYTLSQKTSDSRWDFIALSNNDLIKLRDIIQEVLNGG